MMEDPEDPDEGVMREWEALWDDYGFAVHEVDQLNEILPDGIYEGLLDDYHPDELRKMLEEDVSSGAYHRRQVERYQSIISKTETDLSLASKGAGWSMVVSSALILIHLAWVTWVWRIGDGTILNYFIVAVPLGVLGLLVLGQRTFALGVGTFWTMLAIGWAGILVLFAMFGLATKDGDGEGGPLGLICYSLFLVALLLWTFITLRVVRDDITKIEETKRKIEDSTGP